MRRFLAILALAVLSACSGARNVPLLEPGAGMDATAFHYVSDREVETADTATLRFTARRDPAMRYGVASVETGAHRPRLRAVRESVHFPSTPLPFSVQAGRTVTEPAAARAQAESEAAMRAALACALRESGRRDILLYVHGFNSRFDDTMETLAQVWQAAEETTVPVAFSWPAGNTGALAYFKDRESGEFAIFHLKQTLRILAGVPGLRRIHVVAHSHGSEVVTTALREMVIAERAAGRDPRRALKIENLILAAPDLDFSIARQRLIAERFGPAFGRITVYINPGDGALGLAQMLLAGVRFGRISFDELGAAEREIFTSVRNVHFINVSSVTGQSSHNYFRSNPDVLHDMAEVIVSGAAPDDPARNLAPDEGNFWRLVQERPDRELGPEAGR
ncbi:alpha/beta hydrolase [Roseovarius nitratireducens]|uniref:alpha/beta hydrolase n=1 Tax=Roseovarius nitratireducens TaxID=2044597 RepID=UPI000CE1EC4A|nr:alpha/beta hydrolase [Roseovarius nitratireducens]